MNETEKAIEHYREVKRKKTLCGAHGILDKAHLTEFEYANVVLSALEKQALKPAKLEDRKALTIVTCPVCEQTLTWAVQPDDLPPYCPNCGQRIAD